MKRKVIWLVVSGLMVVTLLVAACAPAPQKEAAPAVKEAAPVVKEAAPVVKEAAPAVREAPPATIGGNVVPALKEVIPPGREAIKVTLTKLDGKPMELLVEKPQHGGVVNMLGPTFLNSWDETQEAPWIVAGYCDWTHEELLVGDWTKGRAGTNELTWDLRGYFNINYQIGALAESWEFPDKETIIFKIRKGVRWHNRPPLNGRELVANDVVYSLKRIYIDTPSSTMYQFAGDGRPLDVSAPDKWTVVVKTRPGFIITTMAYIAGWTRIYPPEVEKQYGNQNVGVRSVGSGPFMITDWVPNSSFSYVRNPDYWDTDHILGKDYRLPYLDGVKLLVIPDVSTREAALRTGKLDLNGFERMQSVTVEMAKSLIKTAPHLLYNQSYGASGRVSIGMRLDKDLPFNDIRVRRALMMAINHQEMVDTLLYGKGDILNWPVAACKEWTRGYTPLGQLPLSSDGFDNNKLYTYHPEEAKKLLAEAGYPNGFKTNVVYQTAAGMDDALQVVKEYWRKIGVELALDPKTGPVYESICQKKTHSEMMQRGESFNFPQDMFMVKVGSMYNASMVNDPKVEALYMRISALTPYSDPWWDVLREYNLYAIDRVYYTWTPGGYGWQFWQPWLKRYYGENDIGPYKHYYMWIKHAWIDQELKKSLGY